MDKYNTLDKKLIVFSGQSSNLEAISIIKILNNLNFQQKFKISMINYINKRRWDILINDNLKLMLSETSPLISLKNFIKVLNNFSKKDLDNIKYIDLRNINRTLITYKND